MTILKRSFQLVECNESSAAIVFSRILVTIDASTQQIHNKVRKKSAASDAQQMVAGTVDRLLENHFRGRVMPLSLPELRLDFKNKVKDIVRIGNKHALPNSVV